MFYLARYLLVFTLLINLNNVDLKIQSANDTSNHLETNNIQEQLSENDIYYWILNEAHPPKADNVEVRLYYESLCPDCISFDKSKFKTAVVMLSEYVKFQTYPYGNARTIKENGVIKFECQHGPPECYGNKLHACAIEKLQNITTAVVFNTCMMGGENRGSNDAVADRCAVLLGLDANPIKDCAKSEEGTNLLEYYGEESEKANFSYVPYILINGKENNGDNFLKDICAAFATIPPPCFNYL